MAYNNSFPVTYQQYYPYQQNYQPQQNYQQNTPNNQNGIIWVQGEAGAKSYLVAPNTTVQLWDSEAQRIYLKSADASGMPSIKTLDYTIRESVVNTQPLATDEYIHKDELDTIKEQIQNLEREVNKLKPRRKDGDRDGKPTV